MKKNTPQPKANSFTLDATDQPLGRLATQVAHILQGKHEARFQRNQIAAVTVIITHIEKAKVTEKKLRQNFAYRMSGYPGGLKKVYWQEIHDRDPRALFLKVVRNMVPKNKLKTELLKNIKFE